MELRRLLASQSFRAQKTSSVCYVDYVERTGKALFDIVCQRDLEGIVAKLKNGHYATEREHSTWVKVKVKNKNYTQAEGRAEFFQRKKPSQSVHGGWDSSGNPTIRHDGITLTSVVPGGPADRAGIKPGDVVLAINDHYLYTAGEMSEELRRYGPGTSISVRYLRYSII